MKKLLLIVLVFLAGNKLFAQEMDYHTKYLIDSLKTELNLCHEKYDNMATDLKNLQVWKGRAKYFRLTYNTQKLTEEDGIPMESEYAFSLQRGRACYLHKQPIVGMIKFALDLDFVDLNYARFNNDYQRSNGEYYTYGLHEAEVGMGIGAGVGVNPISQLKVNLHYNYVPSLSMAYDEYAEDFYWAYAGFNKFGFSVSYKVIELGMEWRYGSMKYDGLGDVLEDFVGDTVDDYTDGHGQMDSWYDEDYDDNRKFKSEGIRFFLGFRF